MTFWKVFLEADMPEGPPGKERTGPVGIQAVADISQTEFPDTVRQTTLLKG